MDYLVHGICAYVEFSDESSENIYLPDFHMTNAFNEDLIFDWILKNIPKNSTLINTWCGINYFTNGIEDREGCILIEHRTYYVYQNKFQLNKLEIRRPYTELDDKLFNWDNTI